MHWWNGQIRCGSNNFSDAIPLLAGFTTSTRPAAFATRLLNIHVRSCSNSEDLNRESFSSISAVVLAAYRTSKGVISGRFCPSLRSPLPQVHPSLRTEFLLRRNSQAIFSLYPSPSQAGVALQAMPSKQGTLGYVKSGQQTLGWLTLLSSFVRTR